MDLKKSPADAGEGPRKSTIPQRKSSGTGLDEIEKNDIPFFPTRHHWN
jgi:hypothetical protein